MKRLSLVALVAFVAFPSAAGAAGPTLGATLGGVPVYARDSRIIEVVNRSAIVERFEISTDGGWSATPRAFTLQAGERQSIELAAGAVAGSLTVRVRAVVPVEGQQQGSILLATALYPGSRPDPFDPLPLVVLFILAVVLVGLGLRRFRHAPERL